MVTCISRPVRRLSMFVPFCENWKDYPCKEWTGRIDRDGYGIKYGGKAKAGHSLSARVHRLEWEFVFGQIPLNYICMHACDNPPCYEIKHLGIGTHEDNAIDRSRKGRGWDERGGSNPNAILTEADVIDIKSILALPAEERPSQKEIGEMYGVVNQTINLINTGKRWAHIQIGCEF